MHVISNAALQNIVCKDVTALNIMDRQQKDICACMQTSYLHIQLSIIVLHYCASH